GRHGGQRAGQRGGGGGGGGGGDGGKRGHGVGGRASPGGAGAAGGAGVGKKEWPQKTQRAQKRTKPIPFSREHLRARARAAFTRFAGNGIGTCRRRSPAS